jgi:hypothetical protein
MLMNEMLKCLHCLMTARAAALVLLDLSVQVAHCGAQGRGMTHCGAVGRSTQVAHCGAGGHGGGPLRGRGPRPSPSPSRQSLSKKRAKYCGETAHLDESTLEDARRPGDNPVRSEQNHLEAQAISQPKIYGSLVKFTYVAGPQLGEARPHLLLTQSNVRVSRASSRPS